MIVIANRISAINLIELTVRNRDSFISSAVSSKDSAGPRNGLSHIIYNVSLRMRKVKRSAASYLRVGNASEVFKSPANFIKKFGAPGHECIRSRYIIYEKSSAAEKELLNLVGLTDSARQFK